MTPDAAAASLAVVGNLDVRDALASVQCPTLVLHRANDAFVDERHSRYAAAHIPDARFVERDVDPAGRRVSNNKRADVVSLNHHPGTGRRKGVPARSKRRRKRWCGQRA